MKVTTDTTIKLTTDEANALRDFLSSYKSNLRKEDEDWIMDSIIVEEHEKSVLDELDNLLN